ncbi:Uncharacterised protein [Klebsiella pneumoniae]|uniref:Uncharacterized protein n=1 Tax=Klebsiella pneumoniae TaxID=573 RepID=A0A2X3CQL2_KLEPN|nr:Uncharacterised protein [Klebsiella pneumoniae]
MAFRWPSRESRLSPLLAAGCQGIVQFTIGRHQLIERRPVLSRWIRQHPHLGRPDGHGLFPHFAPRWLKASSKACLPSTASACG